MELYRTAPSNSYIAVLVELVTMLGASFFSQEPDISFVTGTIDDLFLLFSLPYSCSELAVSLYLEIPDRNTRSPRTEDDTDRPHQ